MGKKWKKVSGLLSALLVSSTLLAACGSSGGDNGKKAATDSAKPANSKPYEIALAIICS